MVVSCFFVFLLWKSIYTDRKEVTTANNEYQVKEETPKKEAREIKKVEKPFASDKDSCGKLKGEWVQVPTFDNPTGGRSYCNIPTSDSGKECIDEAECQGSCLAEKAVEPAIGKCSDSSVVLGCHYYMENGEAVSECRD